MLRFSLGLVKMANKLDVSENARMLHVFDGPHTAAVLGKRVDWMVGNKGARKLSTSQPQKE